MPKYTSKKFLFCKCDDEGNIVERNLLKEQEFEGGYLVLERFYERDALIKETNYQLNDGLPIEINEADFLLDTNQRETIEYVDGKQSIAKRYYVDGDYAYKKWSYDEKGNLTKLIEAESDDSEMKSTLYKYDEKNRVVERKKLDEDGETVLLLEQFEYDDHGNISRLINEEAEFDSITTENSWNQDKLLQSKSFYTTDNEEISLLTNEYNDDGKVITQTLENYEDEKTIRTAMEYNEKGLISKHTQFVDGEMEGQLEYFYDDSDEVILEKSLRRYNSEYFVYTANEYELTYEQVTS